MDVESGKMEKAMVTSGSNEETNLNLIVDWRGKPSSPASYGGMKAASFVLGLQAFEIMGIAAVGNNLITYVINEMHFPLSTAANIVTNFVGTIFLLSLLGGFLSDSYLGSFWTMLVFGFIELSGFILLSVQAHVPQLKPAKCEMLQQPASRCEEAGGLKAAIFFVALYLVALGSGCVKPNMIAHGADQFADRRDNKQLSSYFNAAYFAFSAGELVALTLLVWAQTHLGMDVGFGISAAAMALGLICLVAGAAVYRNKRPHGSIFTPIAQVIVAAIAKRRQEGAAVAVADGPQLLHGSHHTFTSSNNPNILLHTHRFRFLDKACIKVEEEEGPWRLSTVDQVEKVKTLISLLPIFASTIIFNTILAQLQTFSVQQAAQMNTRLFGAVAVPPASLQSIPYLLLLVLVPVYDKLFVPFARRLTSTPAGITPLQRIGSGLLLATLSMAVAATIERRRREAALPLPVLWISPQYVVFGVSEMLTAVGMIEFFYSQSLEGMRSFLTAITYCSYSFGFYLSSVLVSLVNKMTASSSTSERGWLGENDLDKDRLDLFYWLLAGLSLLNFANYLFWSKWFSYNPAAR